MNEDLAYQPTVPRKSWWDRPSGMGLAGFTILAAVLLAASTYGTACLLYWAGVRPMGSQPTAKEKYQVVSQSHDNPSLFAIHCECATQAEAEEQLIRWLALDQKTGYYGTYSIRKIQGASEFDGQGQR